MKASFTDTLNPGIAQGADRLKAEFRTAWRTVQEAPTVADVLRLFDAAPEDRALWDAPAGAGRGGRGAGRSGGRRGGGGGASAGRNS